MGDKAFEKKYAEYYDIFNEGKDYSKECDFLDGVFEKYLDGNAKELLDLGCGTGMHEVALAKRGYSTLGIDLSNEMIEIAKSRQVPNVEFEVGDMSNFDLGKKFDGCISMFSAFVYLRENKQLENAFRCVKEHLRPGGIFVLDCWNGLGVMKELPSSRTKEAEKGKLKIVRKSFPKLQAEKHFCDVKFDVKVFEEGKLIEDYEENHETRFFFPKEMEKYLGDAGFEVLEICKAYELGSKADENAWNMVVISRLK